MTNTSYTYTITTNLSAIKDALNELLSMSSPLEHTTAGISRTLKFIKPFNVKILDSVESFEVTVDRQLEGQLHVESLVIDWIRTDSIDLDIASPLDIIRAIAKAIHVPFVMENMKGKRERIAKAKISQFFERYNEDFL